MNHVLFMLQLNWSSRIHGFRYFWTFGFRRIGNGLDICCHQKFLQPPIENATMNYLHEFIVISRWVNMNKWFLTRTTDNSVYFHQIIERLQ